MCVITLCLVQYLDIALNTVQYLDIALWFTVIVVSVQKGGFLPVYSATINLQQEINNIYYTCI